MKQAEIALRSEIFLTDIPTLTLYIVQLHRLGKSCDPLAWGLLMTAPVLTISRKNSQESNCARCCMFTEEEAPSRRTDIHQLKCTTIPNSFVTHFRDGRWVPGQLRDRSPGSAQHQVSSYCADSSS